MNTRRLGAEACAMAAALATIVWLARPIPVAAQGAAGVAGRWTFTFSPPARAGGARGRGAARGAGRATPPGRAGASAARGRAAGAASDRQAFLDVKPGPAGTITGTVDLNPGGRGAPGNNPDRPVEISDGHVDGAHLTFSAWSMDGYRNRIQFDGVVEGDVLQLTLHRATPTGVETTHVTARRTR